ncbi:MAG: UDP-N-acetylmuramate dehydrogenase [Elusimicrobia bacterium]|nr:UDP-N-acetylmuramate dehydrogenase [Elusimicrobiota bacterium]
MDWKAELPAIAPVVKFDEPMREHTTFRIGGPADAYVEILTMDQAKGFFTFVKRAKLPYFLLGWGSNLLVRDGGIRGIVVRFRGEFEKIEFLEDRRVRAGAGVRLPTLVTECAERGLGGDESLVGVPGTVGGALVMNAGTRDGEIGPLVRSIGIIDEETLEFKRLERKDFHFSYRHSNLEKRVILDVELQLLAGSKVDILKRVREFQRRRQETQPIHTYNVGSTFKNPPGRYVAQMIEEAGLKGMRHGGAKVSEKHANFFENERDASARDVLALVQEVQAKIRERFGVDLELEMKVVGE